MPVIQIAPALKKEYNPIVTSKTVAGAAAGRRPE
jgi:hypothetical protein